MGSVLEFWAERLVTPRIHGSELKVLSPGRMRVSRTSGLILDIEKKSSVPKSKRIHSLIIPGLVDAHTHLVFAGNRAAEWNLRLQGLSYQEIARRGGGIKSTMRATRNASEQELLKLARARLNRMLGFGVTTIEIKSGYGLDLKRELKILRVIQKLKKKGPQDLIATFMGAHAVPPEFTSSASYVEMLCSRFLPALNGLAEFQDVFCEKGYFSKSESLQLLTEGRRWGLKPKIHAHEFGRTGGVAVAAQSRATSADHLQYLSEADIQQLKKSKVIPVILPGTSFFLNSKSWAPARAMWDCGLDVALASDFNPGTNPSLSLPLAGSIAALKMGLTCEEVLIAQTRNAAWALDRRDRGILAPGYRADFSILDYQSFEEIYYSVGAPQVKEVYIAARKVL